MKTLVLVLALIPQEWELSFEDADPENRGLAASAEHLKEAISTLNLVNGLYLSKEQLGKIIELVKETSKLRKETLRSHAADVKALERALEELKTCLRGCGHIPAELEKKVNEREARAREARHTYFKKLKEIEKRLCALLSEAQLCVIRDFNPCTIPPEELKDPVRAGQAESQTRDLEDQLQMIRILPEASWKRVAEGFFEIYLTFQEHILGEFTPEKRRKEMERLTQLARKAREMNDGEFELEKSRLARSVIQPIHQHQDKASELTEFFLRASGGLGKPGKYLLNPRHLPLLEAKYEHVCSVKPADLDAIEPAESCRSCGQETAKPAVVRLGAEPRFEQFAAWLDISGDEAKRARAAVGQGQVDLMTTLAAEREDGRNILAEFLKMAFSGKEADAFGLLAERLPGGKKTYFQRVVEIKAAIDSALAEILGPEKFRKYREANVDPFKIKVGSFKRAAESSRREF